MNGELSQFERTMLFYAGLFKKGRPLLSPRKLAIYRENLPKWQNEEYQNLDSGLLPSKATFEAVSKFARSQVFGPPVMSNVPPSTVVQFADVFLGWDFWTR